MPERHHSSLPAWERGLKSSSSVIRFVCSTVAPRVGAWIEIQLRPGQRTRSLVAPRVGAWIEIRNADTRKPELESLPAWERGLKSANTSPPPELMVAPRVGAWIEMILKQVNRKSIMSLPAWERGLKFIGNRLSGNSDQRRSPRGSVD